ncbi:MAG: hypothetical protein M1536_05550, partial [Firmicutes bacterium]|nr:hypothetical protein [Bacillota bacterium]
IAFDSDRDGNLEIYIMNADGTNQTRLTNNPRNDYLPSFSADGKKIAFTAVLAYGINDLYVMINDLYVMNSDGTGVVDITNTWVYNGYPRFSPVGSKIVFYSTRDRDVNHDEIYTMNSDGTGVTRLTDTSGSGATNADASFSSDGSKIIFISTRDGVLYEIYTMNADGTNQKRLTNDLTEKRYPSWWHTGK